MKNKFIKFLERPLVAISTTLVVAIIIAAYVYINVGHAPVVSVAPVVNNETSFSSTDSLSFTAGEEVNLAFPKGGKVSDVYVKVGDKVKKGQVLASLASTDAQGAVAQANSALEIARANYDKLLNGATGTDIDVYKAAVSKAQTSLDTIKTQQQTLVDNAYNNLLNSYPQAVPDGGQGDYTAPIISGNYNLNKEGTITLTVYSSGSGASFSVSGLTSGSGTVTTTTSQPIGDSGLYITFPSTTNINISKWNIDIPNKKASNYLINYNAYQAALANQSQAVASATSDLNQASTNLVAKQSSARPEDIAIARAQVDNANGALSVAQGAYNNDFIVAPADGLVTVVNINSGEIAAVNQKVIGLITVK